ncbi:hypothetical protein DER45DRAFT_634207 [Fusarium avenaceum]|nr:hypothetical protein DER45DRAFT_634207 [Fusarium avenaceum]
MFFVLATLSAAGQTLSRWLFGSPSAGNVPVNSPLDIYVHPGITTVSQLTFTPSKFTACQYVNKYTSTNNNIFSMRAVCDVTGRLPRSSLTADGIDRCRSRTLLRVTPQDRKGMLEESRDYFLQLMTRIASCMVLLILDTDPPGTLPPGDQVGKHSRRLRDIEVFHRHDNYRV